MPTTAKQVQAYLGFVNYLREYVPCYAELSAPLEAVRNARNVPAAWGPAQQRAFDAFLRVLSCAPTLEFKR